MKLVQIKPVTAFANGTRVEAVSFSVVSISDNLFDAVIFKYTLFDINGVWAGESTFELGGEKYADWDTTPEGAYQIVADAIGIEIVEVEASKMFEVA